MLSSTASHLYWLARYIERAENTARILNVTHRMSLFPHGRKEADQEWVAPLTITGLINDYLKKHQRVNGKAALDMMVLDRTNLSSILSCTFAARENARAIRGKISSEMWEVLNASWLAIKEVNEGALLSDPTGFFDAVKERSQLFHGVADGTMLHDEAFHFIRLGTYLERADNTARIIDVKYHVLLPSVQDVGGAVDYYQWGALLRSVSGFESYLKVYRDAIEPSKIAELLILNESMPRSLKACVERVYGILPKLHTRPGSVMQATKELHKLLGQLTIEKILADGLHEFLTSFLGRLTFLSQEINQAILAPVPLLPIPPLNEFREFRESQELAQESAQDALKARSQ